MTDTRHAPPAHDRATRDGVVRVLVTIALVAPPIVAIAVLAGRTWHPVDDFAIIDLRVRDVWSAHPPLTGLFSRPGWNHPGPAMFWMMAPLSGLTGQAPWATRIGGAIVELGAMAWLAWATWRAGIRMMLTAAATVGMLYLGIGDWVIRQPWNLHLPLIALPLVVFLALIVARGSFRSVIGLAVAATIVVQIHVGFVAPVATAVGFAVVCVLVDLRRTRIAPPRWRSTLAITAGLLALLWTPPVLDVVIHWPGNLGKVARYFAGGHYPHVGLGPAAGIVADGFRWLPPWLGGPTRTDRFTAFARTATLWWLLVPVVLLAGGILASWRSRDTDDRRGMALAGALALVTVLAISRADEPRAYTFEWRVVVAAFVVTMSIRALTFPLTRRRPSFRPIVAGVAVAVLVWGAVDLSVRIADPGVQPLEARAAALRAALPAVRRVHADAPGAVVLVRPAGTTLRSLFDGVINELARNGTDVRVDPELGRIFGEERTGRPADADEVWYVTEQGSVAALLRARPGARQILTTSPLDAAEDAEADRLQAQLRTELVAAGRKDLVAHLDDPLLPFIVQAVPGIDPAATRRLGELNNTVAAGDGCRCAIVVVPGGRTGRA